MATRNGSAEWKGDLQGGTGTFEVGEGAFDGNFSFKSRFEDGAGTNPEELIATAHASCYSMALSAILADAGHTADSVKTSARVTLRFVDDAPTITRIDLDVTGSVPGLSEDEFRDYAATAKTACLVSRALGGVEEIVVDAHLA